MKFFIAFLGVWLVFLQYKLWFAPHGWLDSYQLRHKIAVQNQHNLSLQEHNQALIADVKSLHAGNEAIEERARYEMGMIKKGEVFYQVI